MAGGPVAPTPIAAFDPASVSSAPNVVVIIGTPIDEHLNPSLDAVPAAIERCVQFLRTGQLLILRSTVHPGPFLLVLFAGVASAILGMGVADRVRRVAWIVAAAAGPLVFFNLYVVHNYYLCAVFPAITVFAALGIDGAARLVRDRPRAGTAIAALATFFVLFCTAADHLGVRDIQQWEHKPPAPAQAAMFKAHTSPDEPIIFIKCDWSPVIPYYSERNAVMFTGAKDPGYWAQATDADKYHWLYSCKPNADPKPYLPPGTQATKADEPGLWHVVRKA